MNRTYKEQVRLVVSLLLMQAHKWNQLANDAYSQTNRHYQDENDNEWTIATICLQEAVKLGRELLGGKHGMDYPTGDQLSGMDTTGDKV